MSVKVLWLSSTRHRTIRYCCHHFKIPLVSQGCWCVKDVDTDDINTGTVDPSAPCTDLIWFRTRIPWRPPVPVGWGGSWSRVQVDVGARTDSPTVLYPGVAWVTRPRSLPSRPHVERPRVRNDHGSRSVCHPRGGNGRDRPYRLCVRSRVTTTVTQTWGVGRCPPGTIVLWEISEEAPEQPTKEERLLVGLSRQESVLISQWRGEDTDSEVTCR